MSFYHTYRPQRFADLVGQNHIRLILQTAVATNKLVHAYLFCGTRGTGKTTTARLLAKLVNCTNRTTDSESKLPEPCNQCLSCTAIATDSCMDVIEVDAASNRGIDEIRQLQEQVRFKPQQVTKKIFIIDEVHMLTKEAFNALLKTLEEPPDHLLFILATTEAHKLPATILSRCQRFDFSTPDVSVIIQYLERMVTEEAIAADSEAIKAIAELAHGSFRDSATILEQMATRNEPISLQLVTSVLGLPEHNLIIRYLTGLSGNIDGSLLTDLQCYFERGGNPTAFIDLVFQEMAKKIKNQQHIGSPSAILTQLTRIKYQMKQSPLLELPIIVSLASLQTEEISDFENPKMIEKVTVHNTATLVNEVVNQSIIVTDTTEIESIEPEMVTVDVAVQVPPVELPSNELTAHWQKVIGQLAEQGQPSLVAILRTARPLSWRSPILRISVQFAFHADLLSRQKNRAILEAALTGQFGIPVRLVPEVQPAEDLASAVEELSF